MDCLQFYQLNYEIKKLNYNEFHTPIAINKPNHVNIIIGLKIIVNRLSSRACGTSYRGTHVNALTKHL